jgi:hypothetical protein
MDAFNSRSFCGPATNIVLLVVRNPRTINGITSQVQTLCRQLLVSSDASSSTARTNITFNVVVDDAPDASPVWLTLNGISTTLDYAYVDNALDVEGRRSTPSYFTKPAFSNITGQAINTNVVLSSGGTVEISVTLPARGNDVINLVALSSLLTKNPTVFITYSCLAPSGGNSVDVQATLNWRELQ